MWNQATHHHHLVPEEEEMNTNFNQQIQIDACNGSANNLFSLSRTRQSSQHRRSSLGLSSIASQNSLSYTSHHSQGSASSVGRSQSVGLLHQSSRSNNSMNAAAEQAGGAFVGGTMVNETFRLGPSYFAQASAAAASTNPFLSHTKMSAVQLSAPSAAAAATLRHRMAGGAGLLPNLQNNNLGASALPSPFASAQLPLRPLQRQSGSVSSATSSNDEIAAISPAIDSNEHSQKHHAPSPSPLTDGQATMPIQTGPSELYRLIASPSHEQSIDWDGILRRARSHPHEACFYDPNAGGHVYALHRLLRRTCGEEDEDDEEEHDEFDGCSPPVEVVEAVMKACPRAITRKQAVIDEDDLMAMDDENNNVGEGTTNGNMEWHAANQHPPHPAVAGMPLNQNGQGNGMDEEGGDQAQDNPNEDDGQQDDVRFEYPLAIACECEQHLDIIRLLASYPSKAKPVYRSEVFRSLDYASLPNPIVRILLEEYAGCVLERGMNSEATEGDDDDCPLEQVLFWWDDPDMLGMEEQIEQYPQCHMGEDLRDLWEKLRMMLYAAVMGTMRGYDESKESFRILHHLLRIVSERGIGDVRFPNDFAHSVLLLAKFIQRMKKSMFEERDECGSLPLHIAVSGNGLLQPTDSRIGRDDSPGTDQGDGNQPHEDDANMDEAAQAEGAGEAQVGQNVGPHPPLRAVAEEGPAMAQEDDEEEEDDDEEEGDHEDIEDTSSPDSPSDMEIVRLLLDQHPASIRLRDSQSGSLPIHLALQHNPFATEAIEQFLDLYPRSVTMPDGNGRLPIHLALIQESPAWNKIVGVSPIALETRDPVSGLLPFQLAAVPKPVDSKSAAKAAVQQGSEEQELESLSTCFSLLRMSPCLASGLGDVKQRPQSLIERQIMGRYKPRVTKLEEENEMLRSKVEELEAKLLSMMIAPTESSSSGSPHLKKRKSICGPSDVVHR